MLDLSQNVLVLGNALALTYIRREAILSNEKP